MFCLDSADGVPFLLRDRTLRRTTNVSDQFNRMENFQAVEFNISQLTSLNAGKWFLDVRPCFLPYTALIPTSSAAAFSCSCFSSLSAFCYSCPVPVLLLPLTSFVSALQAHLLPLTPVPASISFPSPAWLFLISTILAIPLSCLSPHSL